MKLFLFGNLYPLECKGTVFTNSCYNAPLAAATKDTHNCELGHSRQLTLNSPHSIISLGSLVPSSSSFQIQTEQERRQHQRDDNCLQIHNTANNKLQDIFSSCVEGGGRGGEWVLLLHNND